MSFNINDNNSFQITRTNYEEYFLLYVDNELTTEQKIAVEAFLAIHPDLQAEMDILLSIRLSAEDISLEDKGFLLADQMKISTIDESLLLYMDNELSKEEKEIVEKKIGTDKEYSLQLQALLQTKLDPAEQIVYPYKKELYRHTERRIAPYWLRVAAAIIIVFGIGAAWLLTNKIQPVDNIVSVPVDTKKPDDLLKEQPVEAPVTTEIAVTKKEQQKEQAIAGPVKATKKVSETSIAKKKAPGKTEDVAIVPQEKSNNLPVNDIEETNEPVVAIAEPKISPKQTLNTLDVTTVPADSYNKQQTSPIPAVNMDDVAKVDKKSSLKGFLRKATRFIERHTDIRTTNENDELLIGAVAVKL